MTDPVLTDVLVARADTPTRTTGRVYSRRVLQDIVNQARSREFVYCTRQPSPDGMIVVNEISHVADNFRMIRGDVLCDIKPLDVPAAKETGDPADYHYHVFGLGEMEGSEVTAYQLLGVGLYPDPIIPG